MLDHVRRCRYKDGAAFRSIVTATCTIDAAGTGTDAPAEKSLALDVGTADPDDRGGTARSWSAERERR
jgi:hypothetical protein